MYVRIKLKDMRCFNVTASECKDIFLSLYMKHGSSVTKILSETITKKEDLIKMKAFSAGLNIVSEVSYFSFKNLLFPSSHFI